MRALGRASELQRAQWLPAEELRARQWRRARALVAHAYAHSPYYRRQFEAAGVSPQDLRDWNDFARLPSTPREALREDGALLATNHRDAPLRRSHTSGSTGRPTTSYFDADAWSIAKNLLKLRARWACGMRPWHRVAFLQETDPNPSWARRLLRQRTFSVHDPIERVAPAVERFAPDVLYGFPGHLARLGAAAAGGIRPTRIFTSGELLDPITRRSIESSFGAPVFDVYGCTETKEIAWQCSNRDGYHVNADWLVLECAGEAGSSDAPAPGSLLATPLFNFAMPLLRYEIGDVGSLSDEPCPCGRSLPLMAPLEGRTVDYLRLPSGEVVSPYTVTCAIEAVPGLRQYQIVQESRDRVMASIVGDSAFDRAAEQRATRELEVRLPGIRVEIRRVERIAHEPSGKLRVVRCELRDG